MASPRQAHGCPSSSSVSPPESVDRELPASPSSSANAEIFGCADSVAPGTFENGAFIAAEEQIRERLPTQDNGAPLRTGMVRASSGPEPQQLLRQVSTRACLSIAEETEPEVNIHPASSPTVEVKTLNLNSEAAPFTPKTRVQPLSQNCVSDRSPEKTPFMQDLLDRLIRVELSIFPLKDMAGQVAALRQDVDFLLRAQRQQSGNTAPNSHSPSLSAAEHSSPAINNTPLPTSGVGEIQHLASQLNGLTTAVSQLMLAHHGQSFSPIRSQTPMQSFSSVQNLNSNPVLHPTIPSQRASSPTTLTHSQHRWSSNLEKPSRMSSGTSYTGFTPQENNIGVNQAKWMALPSLLSPSLHDTLLALPGLSAPTKIQLKAIPCLLSSQEDIVAQTGGDTESILSYGLPAIQLCSESPSASGGVTCLVVCATVDRASQAQRLLHHLGSPQGIRTTLAVSNSPSDDQALLSRTRPQILIATPQSALDLLAMRIVGSEGSIRLLVLDEAETLMYTGQQEIMRSIVRLLPPSQLAQTYDPWADTTKSPGDRAKTLGRQTAIFGGMIPQELLDFASGLQLREPVRVLVRKGSSSTPSSANQSVAFHQDLNPKLARHYYLYVALGTDLTWKLEALSDLLMDASTSQSIVFCASLEAVEAVSFKLASHNIDALAIHDDMGVAARTSVIAKFRAPSTTGTKKALVVCDRLCRTIPELQQVSLIANFDLPVACENYVYHCAPALTAGYGRPGVVVNIISDEREIQYLQRIESFYGVRMLQMPADAASIA